jgi:hypothetical protein
MSKIYGISYTSRNFNDRYTNITNLGNKCGLFDTFKCFREQDIDYEFKEKYKDVWNMSQRGGGYWIWKPYIIAKMLSQMNDDDILVYIDAGCHINMSTESKQRFNEYIDMCNKSQSGLLRFQLTHQEKNYTNTQTIHYFKHKFNINDELMNTYLDSFQLLATVIILRKNEYTIKFFNQVLEILNDDPKLFTDIYTNMYTNINTNEKHRHDQSIMSLLYKYMEGDLIINDETWFGDNNGNGNGNFNSSISYKYPFWATRLRL